MRCFVVAIALVCGVAHADDKPWAKDVPADKQRDALAIYQKGNGFFELAQYKEAYEQYKQAIALWDHPAIRYNAAICLFNMDRPVEAYENLEAALRFGDAPLGPDLYKQGLNYKKLLGNQIAELELQSPDPGAAISLDGKHLFDAPGSATLHVTTKDTHQVVAAKPGYETETRVIQLKPGPKTTLVLKLRPLAAARKLERRWARSLPWTVIAAGAVVGLAGLPIYFDARAKFRTYDDAVAQLCPQGCQQTELEMRAQMNGRTSDLEVKGRAQTESVAAYSAFALGGVGVAIGFALVVLNQPHLAAVTPTIGADHVGLAISAPW